MKVLERAISMEDLPCKVKMPLPKKPELSFLTTGSTLGFYVAIIGGLLLLFNPFYASYVFPLGYLLTKSCDHFIYKLTEEYDEKYSQLIREYIQIDKEDIAEGHLLTVEDTEEDGIVFVACTDTPDNHS